MILIIKMKLNMFKKLRQNPNNGIKGLIVSIRPEDDSFDSLV